MSIMNLASDGASPLLLTLWRALRTLRTMPKDALLELCVPASLDEKEGRARKTLTRWLQLGLFSEAQGKLRLNPPFDAIDHQGDPEFWAFRHAVRRLLLRAEVNVDFLLPEPSGAADFTFACAWLLSSDVYGSHFGSASAIEDHEKTTIERRGGTKFMMQNPGRWVGFREWADFVGLGWNSTSFHLDPTEAVEFELRELPGPNWTLTIGEVLRHLREHIPVLDGGDYAVRARERASPGWRPIADHEISPALTRALLRMEKSREITLMDRGDADRRTLLGRGFRELRRVSHVGAVEEPS
jgi:hypothetical protein